MLAAAALVIGAGASSAVALDPPVVGEPYGSLTFADDSPSIPVYNSNGENWTVANKITGGDTKTGQVANNVVEPGALKPGLYTLTVGNASGTTTADFLVVGATPTADRYFGVQTHFAFPNPTTWSKPETTLPDLKSIGFSAIRDEAYWQNTEKIPGVRQVVDEVREYQQKAADLGFDRLFTADYGNTVVQGPSGLCDPVQDPNPCERVPQTPQEQQWFADYAIAVLDQTGAQRVELWNEFNNEHFNHWCRTGACYAEKIGPIADLIKQARPSVQIVGGGIMGADLSWFQSFFAAGGLSHKFDALSYHPYANPGQNELATPASYVERAAAIRAAQTPYLAAGEEPRPLLLTEVGWSTTPTAYNGNPARALDDEVQAERLAATYLLHANAGVQTVYWYEGVNLGTDPASTELNFGVYRTTTATVRAFQPKESALALWVLRSQVDGYRQTALEKLPNGIWRATYTNGPLTKLALFADSELKADTPADANRTTVPIGDVIPAGKMPRSAVDAYGNAVDVSGAQLTIGTRPVYVTLSTPAVSITSSWNSLNVSASLGRDGAPLEANAPHVADWETFAVVEAGQGQVALRSAANGKYVSVDQGSADAPLQATANEIGAAERFRWIDLPEAGGTFALHSELKTRFVSAWIDAERAPLRAKATEILGWERFTWTAR